MEYSFIQSKNEFFEKMHPFQHGYLFRGQTTHYLREDCTLSIPTSFFRKGCIPDYMIRWTHYAKTILRAYCNDKESDPSMEEAQAVLQHYGWRSFYVDVTKSALIACFFSGNKYEEKNCIHMCEDYYGNPLLLTFKEAKYSKNDANGHIYVIDIELLKKLSITYYDLTTLSDEDSKLRFCVQQGCLIGHLDNYLPENVVVKHFEIEKSVLSEICDENNLTTEVLFPDRKQDYILNSLLQLPWIKTQNDDFLPTYRKCLVIPDYNLEFAKRIDNSVALFEEFWIAENRGDDSIPFENIPFYRVPELSYYHYKSENDVLSEVIKILSNQNGFVVELDMIVKSPEINKEGEVEYEKGIFIEKVSENIISISSLIITYYGNLVTGMGANMPWFYKMKNDILYKIEHPDQCPCNNTRRHQYNFSLLKNLNQMLCDNEIEKIDNLNFKHKQVILT